MYFESRVHVLRPVADANEAAMLIKDQQSSWYEALQWSNGTYEFLCVADGHIDNLFLDGSGCTSLAPGNSTDT